MSNLAPVGSAPLGAGLYGQLDLAGEMAEWAIDWYASYVDPCVDCAYLDAQAGRLVRGGSYRDTAAKITPTSRAFANPAGRNVAVGFRGATSP